MLNPAKNSLVQPRQLKCSVRVLRQVATHPLLRQPVSKSTDGSSAFRAIPPAISGWDFSRGSISAAAAQTEIAESQPQQQEEVSHWDAELEEQKGTAAETFKWFEHWYPVTPIVSLDPTQPTQVDLLGLKLVVWNDGSESGWHCLEDACSHRLAPLSEGRVEGGMLHCAYHGWQFDKEGACNKIPQIVDPKQHTRACVSPRACVKSYPVQVKQGLLWVYPQHGSLAAIAAAVAPCGVPEMDPSPENVFVQRTPWFFRDLPLRFDTVMENVLDPSHVPFAHHGVQGNRNKVMFREMELSEAVGPDGFSLSNRPPSGSASAPMSFLTTFGYQAPYLATYKPGPFGAMKVVVVPTKVGWSRMIVSFLKRKDSKMPWFIRIILAVKEGIPAIEHGLTRQFVLDGDTYMLHVAERELIKRGNNWGKQYYMPAEADGAVYAWRKWLKKFGGEVPTITDADLPMMPPAMPREQVLDRYHQHTKDCPDCKQAVRVADYASMACLAAAAVAVMTVVARAISTQSAAAATATASTSTAAVAAGASLSSALLATLQHPGTLWAAVAVAAAVLLWRTLQGFRANFFFTDYVHSRK